MRILFLAKRRYTNRDTLADRFGRAYRLPLHLARLGHQVELVLVDYRSWDLLEAEDETLRIRSVPVWRAGSASAGFFIQGADAVVASGDCFIGLLGLRLARRLKAPFVFDVYDDYRTFSGYRIFLGWDALGFLVRRAALVLFASRAVAADLGSGVPWLLLPNGVEADEFCPMGRRAAEASLGLPPAARVGYFGSMAADRGVTDLIAAVELLREKGMELTLLVCGRKDPATELDRPWIVYRGDVPHSHIPAYINACDVVALPYRRSPLMDAGSSCKIAEYLFCQRPLAATDTPNLTANFPLQSARLAGRLAQPADPASLADVIARQYAEPLVLPIPAEHSWEGLASTLASSLAGVISPAAASLHPRA